MTVFIDPTGKATFGIAICARCSRKLPLEELFSDPNSPGLMVCIEDLDEYDPYRLPARQTEEINLPFVRPDRVLDPTGPDSTMLLFYLRGAGGGNIRLTESGEYREIEQTPEGATPPWEL